MIGQKNVYANVYIKIICGIVTLAVTMLCSVYGKKMGKLIPFIIGILAGYACATGGTCRLTVRTNLNDAPGAYRIVCRDRASGLMSEKHMSAR